MVVIAHSGYAAQEYSRIPYGAFGRIGVVLFFAISGFVIALNRSKPVGQFVYRRFCRIYPSYWLAMIVAAIAFSMVGEDVSADAESILLYPASAGDGSLAIPYWTLVFEVTFYALASIAFLLRLTDRTLTAISVLWIVAVNFGIYDATENVQSYSFPGVWILLSPAVQVFPMGFICGIHFDRFRSLGSPFALAVAALALAISFYYPTFSTAQLLASGIAASAVVVATADLNVRSRLLLLLGTASYGIYLIHFPAILTVAKLGLPFGSMSVVCFAVIGLVCGTAFGLIDHRLYKAFTASFHRVRFFSRAKVSSSSGIGRDA
jgi:exopolysaccharide production protein ExoZ